MKARILGLFGAVMLAASMTAQATVIPTCGEWTGGVDYDTVSGSNEYDSGSQTCNYELNFLTSDAIGTPVSLTVIPTALGLGPGAVIQFTTFNVGTLNNFTPLTANAFSVHVTTVDGGSMAVFVGTPAASPFTHIAGSTTSLLFSGATIAGFTGGVPGMANVAFDVMLPNNPITSFTITQTLTNVPEPATLALLGLGLTGLALSRRKRS